MTETTPTPGKDLARVGTYGRSSLTEKQQYALALAQAGDLVPKTFWTKPTPNPQGSGMIPARPNPGAILYMLETAAMLGVNPMVGLTNIHIIEGKPSLSANLQAALVREAGHKMRVRVEGEGDGTVAIVQIIRADDPDFTFEVRWGVAEARAAGVLNKDNWKKYFRAMLKARAITECIREACPEVLMGATYSPDELGAITDSQGEPIDLPQVKVPDDSPAAATDVSRETPPEPKPETPIVDDRPAAAAEPFDYGKALAELDSSQEARDLYQRAGREGVLNMEIRVGRKKSVLGAEIVKVGQALAEAEAEAAAMGGPDGDEASDILHATIDDDGVPAVLADDADAVDAEVVEDQALAAEQRVLDNQAGA